jgi:uncharacterized Zn finger protein
MAWGRRKSRSKDKYSGYGRWAPYVPVAERRRQAADKISAMTKKGETVSPVVISGRTIATTFWGKSWCENLESYSDFENRLPRGRTYVRNGSVVDLKITPGKILGLVSGSSLYKVAIEIRPLKADRWQAILSSCTGKIDSLIDLLQGKLSKGVMETVTSKDVGLFPTPQQISLKCSCPDYASMCKHVAAVLYGVGSRLDQEPDVLFLLRGVDHMELIARASASTAIDSGTIASGKSLRTDDLGSLFGIEMDLVPTDPVVPMENSEKNKPKKATVKKPISSTGVKNKSTSKSKSKPKPKPKPKPIKATKTTKTRKKVTATRSVKKTTKTQSARSGRK